MSEPIKAAEWQVELAARYVNGMEHPGVITKTILGAILEACARQREIDAKISDKWATSTSCAHHDENPCCHVRTGASIATAIRKGGE